MGAHVGDVDDVGVEARAPRRRATAIAARNRRRPPWSNRARSSTDRLGQPVDERLASTQSGGLPRESPRAPPHADRGADVHVARGGRVAEDRRSPAPEHLRPQAGRVPVSRCRRTTTACRHRRCRGHRPYPGTRIPSARASRRDRSRFGCDVGPHDRVRGSGPRPTCRPSCSSRLRSRMRVRGSRSAGGAADVAAGCADHPHQLVVAEDPGDVGGRPLAHRDRLAGRSCLRLKRGGDDRVVARGQGHPVLRPVLRVPDPVVPISTWVCGRRGGAATVVGDRRRRGVERGRRPAPWRRRRGGRAVRRAAGRRASVRTAAVGGRPLPVEVLAHVAGGLDRVEGDAAAVAVAGVLPHRRRVRARSGRCPAARRRPVLRRWGGEAT